MKTKADHFIIYLIALFSKCNQSLYDYTMKIVEVQLKDEFILMHLILKSVFFLIGCELSEDC